MVMSTEAGGPAAITRSIRSGTSTRRPDESTTIFPAVAGKDESIASAPAHSSRSEVALGPIDSNASGKLRTCRVRCRALGAQRSTLAHQPAHGAEFLLGR